MRKTIFYGVTLAGILWLQMALNYFTGSSWLMTNVVLVATLYFGLSRGALAGESMGFLWGLLIDASTLGLIGLHALLYAAAGFLAGMLRRQLDENKVWTQTIFSLAITLLYLALYLALDRLFSSSPRAVSWRLMSEPLANALVAPFLFWIMQYWLRLWNMSPQQEE